MPLVISVMNDEAAIQKIAALVAYLEDMSEPLVALADLAKQQTLARYGTETDPEGAPWAPLSPFTAMMKDARGDPGVLQETGHMMESLHVTPPEPQSIEMGYADEVGYASIHQFGGFSTHKESGTTARGGKQKKIGGRSIPARETLGVNEEDLKAMHDLLVAHLERVFGT